ncbi:MAG TPA: hypothetical protein VH253_00475 [Phycisphaerae bacterium]|nr:hypothetical protein [Phycisphaerae bacterium]
MRAREGGAGAGTTVRLNPFQLLMRRWAGLHPYNAGQVMEVSGAADRERWKGAIEGVLGEMGMGVPRFSEREWVVHFEWPARGGGHEVALEQSSEGLGAFFNEELNRPFAAGDVPIRFCALPGSEAGEGGGEGSHYLAAVYDHWIADSRGMRELMQRIFERYQHPERASRLAPLTLGAPAFGPLFRRHVGKLTRMAAARESLRNVWRQRHGFRVNIADPLDFTSHFRMSRLPAGVIDRVYRFAKAHGGSVNDVFLAVLGQTMGAYTLEERKTRRRKFFHFRRQQIGLGTIVDIRDAASEPLDQVFNLYLSSYVVMLSGAEKRGAAELTREIAGRTAAVKKSFGAVKGFWALAMARFWWDLYGSARYRSQLLHKTVPVVAGISNVNMTGSWVAPAADAVEASEGDPGVPRVLDYVRISPTGPLLPLVFTLTTIRDRLTLCMTYRTTSFTDEQARELGEDFSRRLCGLGT